MAAQQPDKRCLLLTRGCLGVECCMHLEPSAVLLLSCSRALLCHLHSAQNHPPHPVQPEAGELGVDVSSVALPVVPIRSRQTRSGDTCILPTVYQASHWRARHNSAVVVVAGGCSHTWQRRG
jgi:hypothetical protein